VLEVVGVEGEGIESLTFVDIALTLASLPGETFAACALALNLKTHVAEIPGLNSRLRADCYSHFGLVGAKVALLACPQIQLRDLMKEVVGDSEELPHSPVGGPWALDAESTRDSYLIDSEGKITEATVDDWIQLAGNLGLKQIDLHTGHSLRFGDYAPNPAIFPNGLASLKAITDRLHAAGILAGLHTYAFFIAKDTPWVTPIPDPRLAKDPAFTLADPLAAESTTIPVIESTQGMSAITGFQIRNSATLQIDDELIIYKGVATDPPYRFTECTRGACGTGVSAHAAGSKVHHLKECFGLFVPDGDSTLFTEVAAKTAAVYNEAGFDMIYLDALDGSDVVAGGENAWHYGSKFVFELCKRLEKPALMEMSTITHHLWLVRSRMGAWDCPSRAMKRFIDMHAIANEDCARMFLPSNLGWWGVFSWSGVAPERTFPDDIEYLCGKSLGFDSGLSLLAGFTPEAYANSFNIRRLAAIIRQYEDLRRSGAVPPSVRSRLQARGEEFTLDRSPEGHNQFRPVQYARHKVQGVDGQSNIWKSNNRFARQPLRVRIEALLSAEACDSPESISVAGFEGTPEFVKTQSQKRVAGSITADSFSGPGGPTSGCFSGVSELANRDSSWTMVEKRFSPLLNMTGRGMGLWVHGDGQGEILNLQFRSPAFRGGGIANHYLDIDFTGWRYFALVEPDEDQIGRYDWPYAGIAANWEARKDRLMADAYPNLHVWVSYDQLESFSLWYNNLPPGGRAACFLSSVKGVPLRSATLKNPQVRIGSQTILFPAELASGSYLEFNGLSECTIYDSKSEPIGQVTPVGEAPMVEEGENEVAFSCESANGFCPRANVTLISLGGGFQFDHPESQ
jgi:hypothetical protein